MAERTRFLVYCAEIYKREKHLTGRQMYALFAKYGVWDYVYNCYDALHTTGAYYTIENIDEFIAVRAKAR
jgi:hypothetical protein